MVQEVVSEVDLEWLFFYFVENMAVGFRLASLQQNLPQYVKLFKPFIASGSAVLSKDRGVSVMQE